MTTDRLDCLIVGGGAAGLMAAVYLGRYKRRVAVIDEGRSRLALIPRSRNVMGFPEGIPGRELWDRMRDHAALYGAHLEIGKVESIARDGGRFVATAGSVTFVSRFVILATGAQDVQPQLHGLAESLKSGQVRYCPVCDGFETQGRRVAVLGHQVHGLRESAFVAGFDNQVTWLSMGTHKEVSEGELERLRDLGVVVEGGEAHRIECVPGERVQVELSDGRRLDFDVLYPALGLRHASGLATALGAQTEDDGQLVVDPHFETTVSGLYAAGDVASGLNQINVAAGQAAIAATAIHNRL